MFLAIALTIISLIMLSLAGFVVWLLMNLSYLKEDVSPDHIGGSVVLIALTFILLGATGVTWDDYLGTSTDELVCEEYVSD